MIGAIAAGAIMSFALPLGAYVLLRGMTRLSALDAAAVAAHYGLIVTFVAGKSGLDGAGLVYDGWMVPVAAVMEAPAILSALWLVARSGAGRPVDGDLWREILLNGSIVLLIGSFAISWITGTEGLTRIASFIVSPFQGRDFPLRPDPWAGYLSFGRAADHRRLT